MTTDDTWRIKMKQTVGVWSGGGLVAGGHSVVVGGSTLIEMHAFERLEIIG